MDDKTARSVTEGCEEGTLDSDVLDKRGWELLARCLTALAFLVLLHLHHLGIDLGGEIEFLPIYLLAAGYLALSLAAYTLHRLLVRRGSLQWLATVADITALCLAIRFSGGVRSYTFLFLGLIPFVGGLRLGFKGSVVGGLLSILGYVLLVVPGADLPGDYNLAQALTLRIGYLAGFTAAGAYIMDLVFEDRRKLRAFYNISVSSNRSPALHNVLSEITQRVAETLHAEIAAIFTHDEFNNCLVAKQPSVGIDYQVSSQLKIPLAKESLLGGVFQRDRPLLLTRRTCREMDTSFLLPGSQVLDLIACPLRARGKGVGIMVLANKLTWRGFTRRDLRLAQLMAPHISVLVDNALLFRRSEEKVAQLTSLIRVVDAINTVANLEQLYNLALDVVRGLFAAEKALINIIDEKTGLMKAVRSFGYSRDYVDQHLSHPFERIQGCYVLGHDDVFVSGDISRDSRCPNMVVGEDMRSVLCVPVRSGKKIFGILHMTSRYQDAFDEEDVTLAKAIGEQIGLAVERANLFADISQLAITDDLTGLYNIRHLKRVLGEEVKRSARYGRPFSFIMLDIDFFKVYNDQHGHLRGDEVLRALAGLLLQNTRDVDMVFRYGGEEFSIIIPEVYRQEAFTMAERIRRVVQDHVFPFEEDQPGGNLTVSMGVAGFPEDASESEELIDNADRALYRAKLSGRNRVCLYDPRQDSHAFHPHVTEIRGGST